MDTTRRSLLAMIVAGAAIEAVGPAWTKASSRLSKALDRLATKMLRESPQYATSLAVSEAQAGGRYIDRLDDASKEGKARYLEILEEGLSELEALDRKKLTREETVSYDVVVTALEDEIAARRFAVGDGATAPYAVTQLSGAYAQVPDFLDSRHPLKNRDQAEAYLTRLSAYAELLDQETDLVRADARLGVVAPDFAIDGAIKQLSLFAALAPARTVLVQSLTRRLPEVRAIARAHRAKMVAEAERIVAREVLPAYERQIEALKRLRRRATHEAGVWKLDDGAELYRAALRANTTTAMTPDEIHEMGLDLVRSLNGEMDEILRAEGLRRGTVAARVRELSERRDLLYPNTDKGRAKLLADLNAQIEHIESLMPNYFGKLAKARLEIKRVPPYTEAGSPGGYYRSPALDGSRPGAYYINLRDTKEWPRFTLPTLTYHEGIPGHHWQIALAQEAEGLPFIRRTLLGFNAYQEGWGLYAETLADEAGVYDDNPLGRLGYLQSMAFRASRLVVDTGMHHKRWSREKAIESMLAATGDQRSSVTTEIERYAVWPGQACGYMVGRQTILRLREKARKDLGKRFDIRKFHDTVLGAGPTPLSVLEAIVERWTKSRA
jgi:uncharacterized protein (DUF885 family)